jgi:hypothetical protein
MTPGLVADTVSPQVKDRRVLRVLPWSEPEAARWIRHARNR